MANNSTENPDLEERGLYQIETFLMRFGNDYQALLDYAAIPVVVTPELLNYLRMEFTPNLPWVAEVDLLLSDLFRVVGYEQYAMQSYVRAVLLDELDGKRLDERIGKGRMEAAANLLIGYVGQLKQENPYLSDRELQRQRWSAMVFIDDRKVEVVQEISDELGQSLVDGKPQDDLLGLVTITEQLSPQLREFPQLINNARTIGRILRDRQLSKEQKASSITRQIRAVTQPLPILQEFEFEVAEIEIAETFNISDIRELVDQALTNEQLNDLLFDNFRDLFNNNDGQSRSAKIRNLVDYADRQGEIPKLLTAIQRLNPNAYDEFVSKMGIAEEIKTCDILVLAANPSDTDMLDLEKEANLIRSRLQEGETGKSLIVQVERAVQVTDFAEFLLQYQPLIVHFSGHGNANGEIILNNDQGQSQAVAPEKLAELLAIVKGRLECVVLNACFSLEKADALVDQVLCVIGMDAEIDDESAVSFAAGFYRGLGFGMNYYKAFELGRNEFNLYHLPDGTVPHFIARDNKLLQNETMKRRVTQTVTEQQTKVTLYPLWFGTNRKPIAPEDISKGFSAERDRKIHYGTCQVAVPKSHKIGSVGTPWWKFSVADDHLKLERQSLKLLREASFFNSIKKSVQEHDLDENCALVFIHGYNVSFEAAALQAAQMGVDLQLRGIMAFYSWPSQAKLTGYTSDEANVEASEQYIAEFLLNLAQERRVNKVHIIAHSIGNRGLLRAMQRILAQVQATSSDISFGQIFLVGPDVDRDIFLALASACQRLSERTTLYVSAKDKALEASGIIHRGPRVGFVPPITVMDGIDTVEVSNRDATLLGNGYFSDSGGLMQDIHELLIKNTAPESRFGLRSCQEGDQTYWQIGK